MKFPRPELLLHSLIPPPLHGLAPRALLGDKWWNEKRQFAMSRNMWKCWSCNIPKTKAKKHKWLEGHEAYDIDWTKGTCRLVEIVSLCHYCHSYIHQGRLRAMLEYGRETQEFVDDVLKHGDNLTAHLKRPPQPTLETMAPWGDWVMIIDGIPHPSRFKSELEWQSYYRWLNQADYQDSQQKFRQFQELIEAKIQCGIS